MLKLQQENRLKIQELSDYIRTLLPQKPEWQLANLDFTCKMLEKQRQMVRELYNSMSCSTKIRINEDSIDKILSILSQSISYEIEFGSLSILEKVFKEFMLTCNEFTKRRLACEKLLYNCMQRSLANMELKDLIVFAVETYPIEAVHGIIDPFVKCPIDQFNSFFLDLIREFSKLELLQEASFMLWLFPLQDFHCSFLELLVDKKILSTSQTSLILQKLSLHSNLKMDKILLCISLKYPLLKASPEFTALLPFLKSSLIRKKLSLAAA